MHRFMILLLALVLLLSGCASSKPETVRSYEQIDQGSAIEMMEQDDGHVVVDVRRLDEYEAGHIPGAICIPNESIVDERPEELPNIHQTILIYCRSGNRSKQAAEKLVGMGYENIYEFGGIIDWTGPVVTGQTLALTVESNPTTGYSWAVEQDSDLFDVLNYYVAELQSEPVSGSGGWQTFILTPKAPGTAQLSFVYARPWEPDNADTSFTCTVEVSEDFQITVIDDGGAEASEQGYETTVRIY